jgi:hypothetical protein
VPEIIIVLLIVEPGAVELVHRLGIGRDSVLTVTWTSVAADAEWGLACEDAAPGEGGSCKGCVLLVTSIGLLVTALHAVNRCHRWCHCCVDC